MLLGKRPRPQIRRTASMTGITVDVSHMETQEPPSDHLDGGNNRDPRVTVGASSFMNNDMNNRGLLHHQSGGYMAMVSPRYGNQSSEPFVETAQFLRTCGLCKRRLVAGRDIYMYRGDTAFCSLECREQQIKQDEKKEKRPPVPAIARSSTR